jgi:acyl-CoA thioester hydrolase
MRRKQREAALIHKTVSKVRFSEVDAMNIAWHGSYVKYLEDGREDFGIRYGIGYMDIFRSGFKAPVVDMHLEYKNSVSFGDTIEIETRYINCEAAKLQFDYVIRTLDGKIVATASTTQVFLDGDGQLVLVNPPFYAIWKEKWKIW